MLGRRQDVAIPEQVLVERLMLVPEERKVNRLHILRLQYLNE